MITRQMTVIFLIYSMSSIRWYISFLYFKTFKIQFYEVPIRIKLWPVKYTFTFQRRHFQVR